MIEMAVAMAVAIGCSILGDLLVKQGSEQFKEVAPGQFGGPVRLLHPGRLCAFVRATGALGNSKMLWGLVLLTFHFIGFITAMRYAPVSLVVPLMSCTYIGTTILARVVLGERVTPSRWASVVVIIIGVVILGVSSK